jgi:hypothetical protein
VNPTTKAVFVVAMALLTGCVASQDDQPVADAPSALVGPPSVQTTQAAPQVYVLFMEGGGIQGPEDVTKQDANGQPVPTELAVGRPTRITHQNNRLAFPWDGAFRYESEIVNMQVSLNHQGFKPLKLISGFPGAATFTSPEFLIPAGTTSMTVYFEGMARVKAGDARMTEGAHFESVSTRGSLKIYNRVVKHQDGSLWLHAWDSNEAHNFDFIVQPPRSG